MNKNEKLLREGSFGQLLLNLCVPAVVIMVVMILYNMADVFFIGQLKDPYMIAAVGLAGPVFSILSGLGTLFGSGGCTVISLALGSGDREKIRRVTALCRYGSVLLGVLFAAVVLVFLEPVCYLIGADETTIRYTADYMRVITLFAPISIFSNVFLNLIRADGAARQSMLANVTGTVVNIMLDPLFILVFHWGVTGAALATGLGNCTSAAFLLWYTHHNRELYSASLSDAKPRRDILGPVISLGLPMAFSTLLMSLSQMVSNNLLVSHDTIAVAAQGVAGKISMLISMIAMGICMGIQPAISYNYAAGDRERMNGIIKKTGITVLSIALALCVFCFVFRRPLLAAFIDDEAVIAIGNVALIASTLAGPFFSIYQLCTTYLQSTSRAAYAAMASLLNKGIIYLPVLFALNAAFQMYGILFTGAVTDTLSLAAVIGLILLAHRRDIAAPASEGPAQNQE